MVNALHHTGFTVTDLRRSLAFYQDLLGFEVVMTQEKRGGYLSEIVGYPGVHVKMAQLKAPASEHRIELFEYVSPRGVRRPLEPKLVGASHACLVVDDLAGLYNRLHSVVGDDSFFSGPVEVDTGVNRGGLALYMRDPDGIILELFQPPGGPVS